jgi:HEPN domain-containing protein
MKQSTKNWLKAAVEDLMTIQSILQREELTNKAVLEEFNIPLIRTHNLETLFLKISTKISVDINENIIAELDKLYLDSRYPGDLGILPTGKPTKSEANGYYAEAVNIRKQIGTLLSV